MADEPISALTLFTSYSTADEVEILDVSDTTFASTGTNKRIPFSTLLTMAGVGTAAGVATVAGGGTGLTAVGSADQLLGVAHTGGALEYKTLTAGPNVTITPAAGSITIASTGSGGGMSNPMTTAGDTIHGGASGTPVRLAIGSVGQVYTATSGAPAWAATVTATNASAVLPSSNSPVSLTKSYVQIPVTITLPTAGTYLLFGNVRGQINLTTSVIGDSAYINIQLYDNTNAVVVPGSVELLVNSAAQVTGTSIGYVNLGPIGPIVYTVTGSATIQLQAKYTYPGGGTCNSYILSDTNGNTTLTAVRIA